MGGGGKLAGYSIICAVCARTHSHWGITGRWGAARLVPDLRVLVPEGKCFGRG